MPVIPRPICHILIYQTSLNIPQTVHVLDKKNVKWKHKIKEKHIQESSASKSYDTWWPPLKKWKMVSHRPAFACGKVFAVTSCIQSLLQAWATIYHLPFTNYHLPITIYHLPFTICHLPFTNLPFTNYQLPFTIYHLPFTIYCKIKT